MVETTTKNDEVPSLSSKTDKKSEEEEKKEIIVDEENPSADIEMVTVSNAQPSEQSFLPSIELPPIKSQNKSNDDAVSNADHNTLGGHNDEITINDPS